MSTPEKSIAESRLKTDAAISRLEGAIDLLRKYQLSIEDKLTNLEKDHRTNVEEVL